MAQRRAIGTFGHSALDPSKDGRALETCLMIAAGKHRSTVGIDDNFLTILCNTSVLMTENHDSFAAINKRTANQLLEYRGFVALGLEVWTKVAKVKHPVL
jgi:hypothetical protein